MGRVLVISSYMGGIEKTTTAILLSAILAKREKRVLLIDLDSQGNSTSAFEVNVGKNTIYSVLMEKSTLEQSIYKRVLKNIDIIPSEPNLCAADIELAGATDWEYILAKKFVSIKNEYDYIIFDCPPSLDRVTINAPCVADGIIISSLDESYAIEAIKNYLCTVKLCREKINPKLRVEGILFIRNELNVVDIDELIISANKSFQERIFNTTIPWV